MINALPSDYATVFDGDEELSGIDAREPLVHVFEQCSSGDPQNAAEPLSPQRFLLLEVPRPYETD
jgi:hypothetical protein